MEDIAIFGAGGLGREVACLINRINQDKQIYNFIGFFDDEKPKGEFVNYGKVLGGIDALNAWTNSYQL